MRKIFSFIAMAAMTLMMASCGGNEPHLVNYKVEITEQTPTQVIYTITPADNTAKYVYRFATKKEFELNKVEELTSGAWTSPLTGTKQGLKAKNLYPASDYVLLIFPVAPIPNNNYGHQKSGEVECFFFTTPDWPTRNEGEMPYTLNGFVQKEDERVLLSWFFNDEMTLYMELATTRLEGRFTKKDLGASSGNYSAYFQSYPVYDIDFTGKYDAERDQYVYEGWFVASAENAKEGNRFNFKMICTLLDGE